MFSDPCYARTLALIRRRGPMSRSELSRDLGLRPNSVGAMVGDMMADGFLREGEAGAVGPGRPRTPLEIDPARRSLVGLAIQPDIVSGCRLNLLGQRIGPLLEQPVAGDDEPAQLAARLLDRLHTDGTLAIGVGAAGFVDPDTNTIVFSRLAAASRPIHLGPLRDRARNRPIVLDNDVHGLAAKWRLTHEPAAPEDVLLVWMRDGAIGASILIDGKPNRGCVLAGNELGHTRFFVDTEPCYCGHAGCLERICATDFLRRHGCAKPLADAVATFDGRDDATNLMLRYLTAGIANAVNFLRPNRLVIASPLTRHAAFMNQLQRQITALLLSPIADRLRIDLWSADHDSMAEAAGWLAMARVYAEGVMN